MNQNPAVVYLGQVFHRLMRVDSQQMKTADYTIVTESAVQFPNVPPRGTFPLLAHQLA